MLDDRTNDLNLQALMGQTSHQNGHSPHLATPEERKVSLDVLKLAVSCLEFNPNAALQVIADQLSDIASASGVAIALEDVNAVIVCCASVGGAPPVGVVLKPDSGLSGECIRKGEVVRCDDTRSDQRLHASIREGLSFRSILILPVRKDQRIIGVLEIFATEPNHFTDDDVLAFAEVPKWISEIQVSVGQRVSVLDDIQLRPRIVPLLQAPTTMQEARSFSVPNGKSKSITTLGLAVGTNKAAGDAQRIFARNPTEPLHIKSKVPGPPHTSAAGSGRIWRTLLKFFGIA